MRASVGLGLLAGRSLLTFATAALVVLSTGGAQGAPSRSSPPCEAWVRTKTVGSHDSGLAIATDGAGNAYVTGQVGTPNDEFYLYTAQLSVHGSLLWEDTLQVSAGANAGIAITVDAFGNSYVTGIAESGLASGRDIITVKYQPDGVRAWYKLWSGLGGPDNGHAIAVDSQGNVYVTGKAWVSAEKNSDFITIKYDTNGNELWVARYNGPGDHQDFPMALAIDGSGNVYVTGGSWGVGTGLDYATVKYDSNGTQVWVARYAEPVPYADIDYATGLAIDSAGNVIVTGTLDNGNLGSSVGTIKYDDGGQQLWLAKYTTGLAGARPSALAIVPSQSIYVAAYTAAQQTYGDFTLIKYTGDGAEEWVRRWDGPSHLGDAPYDLAFDELENIYLTGYTGESSGAGKDWATLKYDPSGDLLWEVRHDTAGLDDTAWSVATDGAGNVVVTGQVHPTAGDSDVRTVKYIAACEPVGGIAEYPDVARSSADESRSLGGGSGSSASNYPALAVGVAVAALALSAGAWYARRRWFRSF